MCNLRVYILIWVLHGSPDAFHMIAAAGKFMDHNFHHLFPQQGIRDFIPVQASHVLDLVFSIVLCHYRTKYAGLS